MKMRSKYLLLFVMVLAVAIVVSGCSSSSKSAYPAKAIEIVSPLPPGGGSDLATRAVAKGLAAELGVPVNVVNKPGGNQIPGTKSVLDGSKDGYNLLAEGASSGSLMVLQKNVPFKLEDRTFIAKVMEAPHAFFVSASSPYKTMKDVAAAAKANPEQFTWAWMGGNTTTDISVLMFLKESGVDISKTKRVPVAGTSKIVEAVAGNHIQFGAGGATAVWGLAKSGDIRVIAITGTKRIKGMEEVPTMIESGYPNISMNWWIGISGPKDMDKAAVARLSEAAKKICEKPEFIKELEVIGGYPAYTDPAATKDFATKENAKFKELLAEIKQ